jgi:fimbrial chaperone protein
MRRTTILVAAAAFLMPALAHSQAAMRVQPLTVDVVSPSQASAVTLQNNGEDDLSLQMRVFKWSQIDGRDHLEPTTEVVASPPVARIPPGSNYTIRLARTAGPVAAGQEMSYRLWVDELPPAALLRDEGGQVDVRLRFDLPVFFRGTGTSPPEVSWSVRQSGSDVVAEATNSGSSHARIQGLEVRSGSDGISFGAGLNGYVLANSSRRWTAPTGDNAEAFAGGGATVVTGDGGYEIRQTVALAD